jgi:hypothetical protein
LLVASCQVPDFNQFQTPKLDIGAMIPPDPNQFARKQRMLQPTTPADLVDGSGICAGGAPVAPASTDAAAGAQGSAATPETQAPAQPTPPRGIALEMTECEVVRIAGQPAEVQISTDARGDRAVTMIYPQPDKPTYRFVAGRLKTVERGAEPPPEQPVKKQPARKPARRAG